MSNANCGVRFIYMLTTSSWSTVCINPQIFIFDFNLNIIINNWEDPNTSKTGMTTGWTIIGRYPNQSMNPRFCFHPAIGIFTLNSHRYWLNPCFFSNAFFNNLNFKSTWFAPAAIHPHKHQSPILGLSTTRPRMNFNEAVIFICLPRQQTFQLSFFSFTN